MRSMVRDGVASSLATASLLLAILPAASGGARARAAEPQGAAPAAALRAGGIERLFARRGAALVTEAFRDPATGERVDIPGSSEFVLTLRGRPALKGADLESGPPRLEGKALVIEYAREGEPLRVTARHEPGPVPFTARKSLLIENRGAEAVEVEAIALEDFQAEPRPEAGGRGQPLFFSGRIFLGVEHPMGEQAVEAGRCVARHFPGARIEPGGRLSSKSSVAGIAPTGRLADRFDSYIRSIARRPERFIWVYNTWGAHDHLGVDHTWLDRPLLARIVDALERLHRSGIRFDCFQMDAGLDGDQNSLLKLLPDRKPSWLEPELDRVRALGMRTGVWTELSQPLDGPYREEWGRALDAAARDRGFGILKLDFCSWAVAPWPAAERNADLLLGLLDRARAAVPDLLVVAFNGFNASPWWLSRFDTQYAGDPRPSPWPALRLRQSIHLFTDSAIASLRAARYPWTTIDDCGVLMGKADTIYWLGIEGWRDSLSLTLARGGRIAFLYGGIDAFDAGDVEFLKRMQDLGARHDRALGKVRTVGGDLARGEVYGYADVEGAAGIIALHNPSFEPRQARVPLDDSIGIEAASGTPLPISIEHPQAGRLPGEPRAGGTLALDLRPFEVVLLSIDAPGSGDRPLAVRAPIDPTAHARIPLVLRRAAAPPLGAPPPAADGKPFQAARAWRAAPSIPSGTAASTLALPLSKAEYQKTRAALVAGGKAVWLESTPRRSTPRIWSGCPWTTFHGPVHASLRGMEAEVWVLSSEEDGPESIETSLYLLGEAP